MEYENQRCVDSAFYAFGLSFSLQPEKITMLESEESKEEAGV